MKTNTALLENLTQQVARKSRLAPIAFLVGASLACMPQPLFATTITKSAAGNADTVTNTGNTWTVNPDKVTGNAAFNDFAKFNVDAGHIANLNFNGADTLVNVIRDTDKSTINGQVNAIKSGKIGGNLIFANANGILVGSTGAIHAGSITLLTPTKAYLDVLTENNFTDDATLANLKSGSVPISPGGTITIKGNLYALKDAVLKGHAVEINGAKIMTGPAAVSAIGSLTNVGGINAGTGLSVSADGSIEIVAESKSEQIVAVDLSNNPAGAAHDNAQVTISNGAKLDSGNITVKADAEHSVTQGMATASAIVDIATGTTLEATGTITVVADSNAAAVCDLGGMGSIAGFSKYLPAKIGDTMSKFAPEVQGGLAFTDSKAEVTVGGTLTAAGDISVGGISVSEIVLGLSGNNNLGFALGSSNAAAKTNILSSAVIKSTGANVTISSLANNTHTLMSKANPVATDAPANSIAASVVIGFTKSSASTDVAAGARLESSKDTSVTAEIIGKNNFTAKSTVNATDNAMALTGVVALGETNAGVNMAGNILAGGNGSVTSKVDLQENSVSAGAGTTINALPGVTEKKSILSTDPAQNPLLGLLNKVGTAAKVADQAKAGLDNSSGGGGGFNAAGAGAFAYSDNSNKSAATVTGKIDAGQKVTVSSYINDDPVVMVTTSIDVTKKSEGSDLSLAGSVALTFNEYDSKTLIAPAAEIIAGGAADITSDVFVGNGYDIFPVLWAEAGKVLQAVKDGTGEISFKDGNIYGITEALDKVKDGVGNAALSEASEVLNSLVLSSVSSGENNGKLAAAGTVNHFSVKSSSTADIAGGAKVTVNNNKLILRATNAVKTINIAGQYNLTSGEKASAGGSYFGLVNTKTTRASVGDGAVIKVKSFDVTAETDTCNLSAAVAGGLSGSLVGVNGSVSVVDINNKTTAQVSNRAQIEVTNIASISGTDEVVSVAVAGALSKAGGAAIGVSVAVNTLDRDTRVGIFGAADRGNGYFKTGRLTVSGKNDGLNHAYSIAGSIVAQSDAKQKPSKNAVDSGKLKDKSASIAASGVTEDSKSTTKIKPGPGATQEADKPKFGVAISGDASVNFVSESVSALVQNAKVEITSNAGELQVGALNATSIYAVAGSFAIAKGNSENKAAVGFAGSFAYNQIDGGKTEALITGSEIITKGDVVVSAENASKIMVVAAGATGAVNPDSGVSVGIAGAVTINTIETDTRALITNSTIDNTGRISVATKSDDNSIIRSIAGSVSFTSAGGSGAAVSIGADVAVNRILSNSEATIKDITVTNVLSALKAEATNASLITSISGAVSLSVSPNSPGIAGAGAFSYNQIGNEGVVLPFTFDPTTRGNVTKAEITNVRKTDNAALDVDTLVLTAKNSGDIWGLAGAVSVSVSGNGAAIGGAWVQSGIASETTAKLGVGSNLKIANAVEILSQNSSNIYDAAIAVGVTTGVAGIAGSLAVNTVANTTTAEIAGSVTSTGALNLKADDSAKIYSGTGGVGISFKGAAVGFALSLNYINSETVAKVSGTGAKIGGTSVTISAINDSEIWAGALGGAGASDVAITGSGTGNVITSTAKALIENATLNTAGAISLNAADSSKIYSGVIAVSGAGTAAIGASVSYNEIGGGAVASIKNSTITGGILSLNATSTADISSAAVAGGGSGTVAAMGAMTLNRIDGRTVEASILNGSKVTLTGALSVIAADDSVINSLAGGAAGSGTVGLAGAAAYNTINNSSVLAKIAGSGTDVTAGEITIDASSDAKINSASISASGAGTVSGAASGAYNAIGASLSDQILGLSKSMKADGVTPAKGTSTRVIRASVESGAVVKSTGAKALKITATDKSSISAIVGTASGSGTCTVSGSLVYNHISGTVEAVIDGSGSVTAAGLDLLAQSDASIKSLAADGSGSGGVTVGGTITANVIDEARLVRAGILNGSNVNLGTGAAGINAKDQSVIFAIAINGAGSGGASVGAALSLNFVGGNVEALVSGANTELRAGALTFNATTAFDSALVQNAVQSVKNTGIGTNKSGAYDSTKDIKISDFINGFDSANIYSAAVAGNGSGGGAAAGAVTLNRITREVRSGIVNADGGKITITNALSASATDASKIFSAAGAVSGAGGAALVGAVSYNEINGKVETLISGNGVAVSAKSISLASEFSGTVTSAALSGAGAGTVAVAANISYNKLNGKITSAIKGNWNGSAGTTITTTGGDVALSARDTSKINVGTLTVAGAGAVAIGGTALYNNIDTETTAQIDKVKVTSSNDVKVEAISAATIQAAGASAVISTGVSVSGLAIVNNLNSTTKATISNGADVLAQGNVLVSAARTGTITIRNASVVGSLAASVGGTALVNIVRGTTEASIIGATTKVSAQANNGTGISYYDGTGDTTARGVIVKAVSANTITGYTGGVAASGGVAVAVSAIVNSIEASTKALITGAQINQAAGAGAAQSAVVAARDTTSIENYAAQITGGIVGFGGVSDNIFITKMVEAGVRNATVSAKNKIDVRASSSDVTKSRIGSVSIGLVAGAINVALIDSAATTKAYITGGTTTSDGALNVTATSVSDVNLIQLAASGGWVAGSGAIGIATIDNATSANVGGTVNVRNSAAIKATGTETITSGLGSAAIGNIAAAASVSANTIRSTTSAGIDAGTLFNQSTNYANAAQNVSVLATDTAMITDKVGAAAGGIAAFGAAVGIDTIKTTVAASIGSNAKVSAGNDVTVSATGAKTLTGTAGSGSGGLIAGSGAVIIGTLGGNGTIDSSKLGETKGSITGALGGDFLTGYLSSDDSAAFKAKRSAAGNLDSDVFNNTATNGTTASIGAGAVVNAGTVTSGTTGNLSVSATDTAQATVKAGSVSAGLASAGAGYGNVYIKNTTTATLAGTASAKGAISVNAETVNNGSSVTASGGSVAIVGLNLVGAFIQDCSVTNAYLGDGSIITRAASLSVLGKQKIINQNAFAGTTGVGVVSAGYSSARSTSDAYLSAFVGKSVTIGAASAKPGNVTVKADGEYYHKAEASGLVAGIVGASENQSYAQARFDVKSYVDNGSTIYSSAAFLLESKSRADAVSKTHGLSAGAVTLGNNKAITYIDPRVYAGVGKDVVINANSIDVVATHAFRTDGNFQGGAVAMVSASTGGLGTFTNDSAEASVGRRSGDPYTTRVLIDSGALLEASGDVLISAFADDHVFADASLSGTVSAVSRSKLSAFAYLNDRVLDVLINGAIIKGDNVSIRTTDLAYFISQAKIGSAAGLLNSNGSAFAEGGVRQSRGQYRASANNINIDGGTAITARNDLLIRAETAATGSVFAELFSNFKLTGESVTLADSKYAADTKVTIGAAILAAKNITIQAENKGVRIDTAANTKVDFSGSTTNKARALLSASIATAATFKSGAVVRAQDQLNVFAGEGQDRIRLSTTANSKIHGVTGSTDAESKVDFTASSALIDVQSGAELYGRRIKFLTDAGVDAASNFQNADAESKTIVNYVWEKVGEKVVTVFANIICFGGLFCKPEKIVEAVYDWVAHITNSHATSVIHGTRLENLSTEIRINGVVSSAESQTNRNLIIDASRAGTGNIGFTTDEATRTITVNDVVDNTDAYIHLIAKGNKSSLTGNGSVEFSTGIDNVNIENQSVYNLKIGNITMVNDTQDEAYLMFDAKTIIESDGLFTPYKNYLNDLASKPPVVKTVDIKNSGAAGDLILEGIIKNENGVVSLNAGRGNLVAGTGGLVSDTYVDGAVNSLRFHIVTHELNISAENGAVGTSANPLAIRFWDLRDDANLDRQGALDITAHDDVNLVTQVLKNKCLSCPNETSVVAFDIRTLGKLNIETLQGGVVGVEWNGATTTFQWWGQQIVGYMDPETKLFPLFSWGLVTEERPDYSPKNYVPILNTSKATVYKLGNLTIGDDINIAANGQKIVVTGTVLSGLHQLVGSFDNAGVFSTGDYYDYATTTTATAVTLENFRQKGGHITITGADSVTGTGTLKVLDGYVKLDITNAGTRDLTLKNIALEPRVNGSVTINGISAGITGAYGTVALANHGFAAGSVKAESVGAMNIQGTIANNSGNVTLISRGNILGSATGHVKAATLNLTATNGSIDYAAGNGFSVQVTGTVNAQAAGLIRLNSVVENLTAGEIKSTDGNVVLTSARGILDDGVASTRIRGNLVTLTAMSGAINVQTAAKTITSSSTGSTTINELDSVTLESVTTGNGAITVNAGSTIITTLVKSLTDSDANDITLTANGGDIGVGQILAGTTAGDIVLTATGKITSRATTLLQGDNATLNAGDYIVQNNTQLNSLNATAGAGGIYINEQDAITLNDVTASNGAITVIADGTITATLVKSLTDNGSNGITLTATTGDIAVGEVLAGTANNDLVLTAAGNISSLANNHLQGDNATLVAGGYIEQNNTQLNSLNATARAGRIYINEQDAITLNNVTATDGAITVIAGGTITATVVKSLTDSDANDITLTATAGDIAVGEILAGTTAGDIALTAAGNITSLGNNHLQGDNATLVAGGYIEQNNTQLNSLNATAGVGRIYINEQDAITLNNVTATNGAITVTAGDTITATVVKSLTDNGTNGITLTATTGDIEVGEVLAGAANNDLVLTAAGSITSLANNHLQGDNATLSAGGTIEQNNTQLNSLNAINEVGKIYINEQDAITLNNVTATDGAITVNAGGTITATLVQSLTDSDANDITLTTTAGDIEVGEILAGTTAGDVILGTPGNITSLANTHLQADNATLEADGFIDLKDTELNSLNAYSTSGYIAVNERDAITLNEVMTGNGAITVTAGGTITATLVKSLTDNGTNGITLTATTGDIAVGEVLAGTAKNDLVLTAAGSITSLANNHLQGDNAVLNAVGTIEQNNTQLNSLNATNEVGRIYINEQDAITLNNVTATDGAITVTAGGTITATVVKSLTDNGSNGITLTATTGDIQVGEVLAGTANNDLVLTAAGNITSLANNHLQGDNATLVAGGTIEQNNTQLNSLNATAGAGKIYINEQDAIVLNNVTATNGAITVIAGGTITATVVKSLTDSGVNGITLTATTGDIQVGEVLAGTANNDLVLTAAGSITSLANNHLQGDNATLDAGGSILLNNTELNRLSAEARGGNIEIAEQNDINLARIRNTARDGIFALTAGTIAGGQITVLLGEGGIATTGGLVSLISKNAGIQIDDVIATTGGAVELTAARDIAQSAPGDIATGGGSFLAIAGGRYVQEDGARVDAGSGTITVEAEGDIVLGNLTTTNNTGDAVRLTARNGAILDGGDTDYEIIANQPNAIVTLTAKNGIGNGTLGALEMLISNLAAEVTGEGDLDIDNAGALHVISSITYRGHQHIAGTGNVYIDKMIVDAGGGTTAHNGSVIAREGNLYLLELESKTGDLLLAAEESILNQAPKAVLRAGNISFTAHNGGIGQGGVFTADIFARIELFANKEISIDQTRTSGDLNISNVTSKTGTITLKAPGSIIADRIMAGGGINLIAGGQDIRVNQLGGTASYAHYMDARHADYLNAKYDADYPNVRAASSPGSVFLHVMGADGRIQVQEFRVRDLVRAFADNSFVRQMFIESESGNASFEIAGRELGQNGDRMETADWTIGTAGRLDFSKYWSRFGRLSTKADMLVFADAWTQRSDIWNTRTYLIAENRLHTVQGGDVQIYSLDERFWVIMAGRETYTNAYYINYRDQRDVEAQFRNEDSLVRLGRKANALTVSETQDWVENPARGTQNPTLESELLLQLRANEHPILRWDSAMYQPDGRL